MEHLNYFDYISFPDRTERDKIRTTFFNTHELRIDELDFDKLSNNHIVTTLKEFDKYSKLNSKILNFNNTVVYLDLAILKMVNYFDLLSDNNKNEEEKIMYEALYRQACRNVSCEVYIYEEKVKNFLRFILKLNKGKNDKSIVALKKACDKVPYGKEFLIVTDTYHRNENVIAIKKLRNDEVHNSSELLIDYKDKNSIYNFNLYQKIRLCLIAMKELKKGLYSFIKNYIGL